MTFSLKGHLTTVSQMREISRIVRKESRVIIRILAEEVVTISKQQHVPVDRADLMNSGHVVGVVVDGEEIVATISFGGPGIPQAVVIHEFPEFNPRSWRKTIAGGGEIKWNPEGRGPEYLRIPLVEMQETLQERVSQHINAALSRYL